MAEPATATTPTGAEPSDVPLGDLTVLARDLHVYYRVYEDRRPRIGEIFARGLKRPGYREVKAVQGVDLEARQGESIGIIGRNGSGKSTLAQAIAGLLPPSHGEVYASSQPSLLGVSAALQSAASGRRNILLGGLALGLSREEVEEQMDEIIEWTGLEDFIDMPIRTYSSGMKARLHFAIATSVEPEILIIDEALNVGDEEFKERSKERIQGLLEKAGTIFVVSHSMGTITDLCNRVIWLDKGRIRADGEPDEVIQAYRRLRKKQKRNKERKKEQRQRSSSGAAGPGDDGARKGGQAREGGQARKDDCGAGEGGQAREAGQAREGDGGAREGGQDVENERTRAGERTQDEESNR